VLDAVEDVFFGEPVALVESDGAVISFHDEQDVRVGLESRVQRLDECGADSTAAEPLVDVDPMSSDSPPNES
jgi:hypothetical protein